MDEKELRETARRLMDEHGLEHWGLKIGSAKRQAGVACFRPNGNFIRMSKALAAVNPREDTIDTILHEIAHAIAGARAGHGPKWKAVCREIGANPERVSEGNLPDAPYQLWCQYCGHTSPRYRRTAGPRRSCGVCHPQAFNEDYLLVLRPTEEITLDRILDAVPA